MARKKGAIKPRKYMRDNLYNAYMKGKGHSKHELKDEHNSTKYIHSNQTFRTYVSQCNHFADWLSQNKIRDIDDARDSIPIYLKSLEERELSASSIVTALNAIAKAFKISTMDIDYTAPRRERAAIKRSRYTVQRDAHFSEVANKELIDFVSATGLRRHELEQLHGCDLAYEDGKYKIYVAQGKGGKTRFADVVGSNKEIENVVNIMRRAKEGKVFEHIHNGFDEHYYRSLYACRCYKLYARDIDDIPKSERYICRKDKAGIVYDKRAMLYASRQLGHNRIDVIANYYLHNL
ncbi:MAG: site-specific integrase [Lachnospiraceae bacterium]|nr:site-specific integrase [Lachnospiraceae bacterium]